MTENKPVDLDELMSRLDSTVEDQTEVPSKPSTEVPSKPSTEVPSKANDTPKIRLVIATPSYGGGIQAHYLISLISTIELLREKGIEYEVSILPGDSLVQRARNALVAKFLSNPKNTHLLFIDSDIHWNPIEILKLLSHNKPLVGGIYPKKAWNWDKLKDIETFKENTKNAYNKGITEIDLIEHNLLNYDINYLPGNKSGSVNNNLIELRHIATGFMMIQRATLERMIECFGDEIKYTDDCGALQESENAFLYAFFDCKIKKDHYLSEDWLFCDRWRQLGGQVYADISIALSHLGYSAFSGRYLSTLNINA